MENVPPPIGRREFAAALVSLGGVGTAGCSALSSSSDDTDIDTSSPTSLSENWIELYQLRRNDPDGWQNAIESDVHSKSKYLDGINDALDFYREEGLEGGIADVSAEVAARDLSEVQINSLRMPSGLETGAATALSDVSTALVDGTYESTASGSDASLTENVRHFLAVEDGEWQFVDVVQT